jgi:hypothetical protein
MATQTGFVLWIALMGGHHRLRAVIIGKKRCQSSEGVSGNPRNKVSEQNGTFT